MKCHLDCIACFIRQSLQAARFVSDDPDIHKKVVRRMLEAVAQMDFDDPPPVMARQIQHTIQELTGCDDPYFSVKRHFNRLILELLDGFREKTKLSADPFNTAVRLAIAGNIIDFGPFADVDDSMVHDAVNRSLLAPIPGSSIRRMKDEIDKANNILYLADNAGEIVFDRLLIEQMPREKITVAVKGGPIINDALMEDAQDVGLTELVHVVDNGSDAAGTVLETCSEDFFERFEAADVIIAKGQANYETLSEVNANTFFLFTAKCPVIAGDAGCLVGDMVVRHRDECGCVEEASVNVA